MAGTLELRAPQFENHCRKQNHSTSAQGRPGGDRKGGMGGGLCGRRGRETTSVIHSMHLVSVRQYGGGGCNWQRVSTGRPGGETTAASHSEDSLDYEKKKKKKKIRRA